MRGHETRGGEIRSDPSNHAESGTVASVVPRGERPDSPRRVITATLADNATASDFAARLPMTVTIELADER